MDINTLIRYALAGLTEGARLLRYVFITALLFTLFTIGASFGHLALGDNVVVWQVLLPLVTIGSLAVLYWHGFSVGGFVNMVGLILVALTGLNPTFRLLGPSVGALYVLVTMLLIGGAASTGTILGYGIAPGEATITNAPSGKVWENTMLVAFWLVLTVLFVGIATPFTEPLYVVVILGLALVVVPGSLYLGIGDTTRYVFDIVSALLIAMVAVGIFDSLHKIGVLRQNPVQQLWSGITTDKCAQIRDTSKGNTVAYKSELDKWAAKNTRWLALAPTNPDARQDLATYDARQAEVNTKLRAADAEYERCVTATRAPAGGGNGIPVLLWWLHTVLYGWPWWATMLILPLVAICLFGLVFLGGNPSDTAVDRALRLWVFWAAIVIFLRII